MAVDVLVTGACGVLGRHIVQTLRDSGREVVASGRVAEPDADVIWDITLKDGPQPNCNPAAVVHAAARVGSYQQPLSEATILFDVNVTGTLRVAQWCVSHQVKRLVLISGAIVYGEWSDSPKNEEAVVNPWLAGPYAVSKWCGEQAASVVRSTAMELTILRLSSLYGPGYESGLIQRLLKQGMETGNINLDPPFDDAFDLLNVHDAAATVERALEAKHAGLWNVGGGGSTGAGPTVAAGAGAGAGASAGASAGAVAAGSA